MKSTNSVQIDATITRSDLSTKGFSYLHIIEGRIRIKLPGVKSQSANASRVEKTLYRIDGVAHVHANPTTGNVLIFFNPEMVTGEHILQVVSDLKLRNDRQPTANRIEDLSAQQLAKTMAKRVAKSIGKQLFYVGMQIALDRITLGLIPANVLRR